MGRDLGQFSFSFLRQDDYEGPLPMRQDLLPTLVYLEFCTFSQRVITTLHALWYLEVPWGIFSHQIWPSYERAAPWMYTWLPVNLIYSKGWTDILGWISGLKVNLHKQHKNTVYKYIRATGKKAYLVHKKVL